MRINNMITSIISVNKLQTVNNHIDTSNKKLSTGMRINSASDDAAGLSVSVKFRAQASSLDIVKRNISDGVSLVQTAEGALDEIHNMLNRVYELGIQSSNGIYDTSDKSMMVQEARELKIAIEDIINSTSFNGIPLLQGDAVVLQVGINKGDTLEVNTPSMTHLVRHLIIKDMPVDRITDPENITNMINRVSEARANLGAIQNRLEHSLSNVMNTHENIMSAESRIRDTDMASELATKSKYDLMSTMVSSILSKTMNSSNILKLLD